MNSSNNQFVKLPNTSSESNLTPKDKLVYAYIKRYMNDETLEAFPQLSTIEKDSGITRPTILSSITKLEKEGYIKVYKRKGTSNIYKFNNEKKFEKISHEFLSRSDLSFKEKAVIAASQQYMFKDVENYGKISYSDKELADILNISKDTLQRVNKSLVGKQYLSIVKNENKDQETGIFTDTKIYHLKAVGQAIIWSIDNLDERQTKTEDDVAELKETVAKQQKLIEALLKERNSNKSNNEFNF